VIARNRKSTNKASNRRNEKLPLIRGQPGQLNVDQRGSEKGEGITATGAKVAADGR
jgi:hypothetical protein